MKKNKTIVVALGGNALIKKGQEGTISEQFDNTIEAMKGIIGLIKMGYKVVITHGNGPIVGYSVLRVEKSEGIAPYLPLGICVADTQGGIGYMIALCLKNVLRKEKIDKEVVAVVTQVLVDANDPSFKNPTKPIGPFYSEQDAKILKEKKGWDIIEDSGRGWRRVVPSPFPKGIIEKEAIKFLLAKGFIVIAAGGGGIPVKVREEDNELLKGVPAVIDKDLASYALAKELKADLLMILTSVDKVAINFNKPNQKFLDTIKLKELDKLIREGHFPPGSMGPKIEAAKLFLENGGKEVVICSLENALNALEGKAGTRITK